MAVAEGQILGGYRLLERIGHGRLGDVWLAQNVQVEAMVRAVKIIRPELAADSGFRDRFLHEAALLDALKHENIVQVMSVRDEDGTLFTEMELLEGRTAAELLAANSDGLSLPAAMEIARQAAAGLGHAHAEGIAHGGVRPEELFITRKGRVKILDFAAERELPHVREASEEKTDPFVAPDLIAGAKPSPAGDVHALGKTLFELITAKPPAVASTIRSVKPDAPDALDDLVKRAMARVAAQRPTAMEFEQTLAQLIGTSAPAIATLAELGSTGKRYSVRSTMPPLARPPIPAPPEPEAKHDPLEVVDSDRTVIELMPEPPKSKPAAREATPGPTTEKAIAPVAAKAAEAEAKEPGPTAEKAIAPVAKPDPEAKAEEPAGPTTEKAIAPVGKPEAEAKDEAVTEKPESKPSEAVTEKPSETEPLKTDPNATPPDPMPRAILPPIPAAAPEAAIPPASMLKTPTPKADHDEPIQITGVKHSHAAAIAAGVAVLTGALVYLATRPEPPMITALPPPTKHVVAPPPPPPTPAPAPCPEGQMMAGGKCVDFGAHTEKEKTAPDAAAHHKHGARHASAGYVDPAISSDDSDEPPPKMAAAPEPLSEEPASGSVDKEMLGQFIRGRLSSVQSCYERELKLAPSIRGKLVIGFTITPKGRVSQVAINSDTMHNENVSECVQHQVRSWNMPFHPAQDTPVSFPFVFQPGG